MKIYIIAGEDSGDLHSSNLMKALKVHENDLAFRGVGGDLMKAQGMELVAHIEDINFMGFVEVVKNLKTIRQLFRTVEADILYWLPDVVVLVDYPGFNLRLAPFIKEQQIPLIYYISPQVWAWKKGRVKKIKALVDRMMVILPFEKKFYAKEGLEVDFVGHPLLDVVGKEVSSFEFEVSSSNQSQNPKPETRNSKPQTIALLPGSRKQEIKRMLPVMLEAAKAFPEKQFIIGGAPSRKRSFYEDLIGESNVELWMNRTYELLERADYAWVTSGTATLETALFKVPEVVCYKGSWLSFQIGKRLVNVKFISLVNLILDREAVKELLQSAFRPDQLITEQNKLMSPERKAKLQADYDELYARLGEKGASDRAARIVLETFKKNIS
jgi:lipid-A-disaccharide synthase